MADFLAQNWGSILVLAILAAVCALAVWRLCVQRKKGKGGCGGSCEGCQNCGVCRGNSSNKS